MPPLARLAVGPVQAEAEGRLIAWGLMAALSQAGCHVQHFLSKACFEPYPAPFMATGNPSRHLDSWLMSEETCREILAHGLERCDLALVEGRFDVPHGGTNPKDDFGVTSGGDLNRLCDWLDLPRLAILDAALLDSCRLPQRPPRLDGILLDRTPDAAAGFRLQTSLESIWGAPVLGWLPRMGALRNEFASLAPGAKPSDEALQALGRSFIEHANLDSILRLARRRSVLDPSVNRFKPVAAPASVVVATAYDEAFGCYFPDTLDLLERRGARLVDFSPLRDDALPAGVDIVYIGCGRPERHAAALADNHCMRSALRAHAASGKRIYAEGGGLAYLCHHLRTESEGWLPMAGVLPAAAWLNPDPGPVTPIEIEFSRGNWLGEAGTRLRGYRNGTWSIQSQIDRDGHSPLVDYALATSQRSDLIGYRAALGSRVHLNFAAQPGALQGFFSDSLPQPSAV